MARKTKTKTETTQSPEGGAVRWRVAEGVNRVNGAPVVAGEMIELTEREALFDLSLGRIERAVESTAMSQNSTGAADAAVEGESDA